VALAWDPHGNGSTAVHAGFGIHYSLLDALAFQLNSVPPYNGSISFANESLFKIIPVVPNVPQHPSAAAALEFHGLHDLCSPGSAGEREDPNP